MAEVPSLGRHNRKREAREDEGVATESGSKRQRYDSQPPRISLLHLPIELLYSIHLYAKNPSFTILNRHFKDIFSQCPLSIKSGYLLARWHEAYCYGNHPSSPLENGTGKSGNRQANKAKLPSTPSEDLLQGGSMPELTWSSRFLPVLPTSDLPYPLSNSFQRSADHFVLDYCLRYPICNNEVLSNVEDRILSCSEFGNIMFVIGLWKDEDGQLCNYDAYYGKGGDIEYRRPCHLIVNDLPKRIFQNFEKQSVKDDVSREGEDIKGAREQDSPSTLDHSFDYFDISLARHLQRFGKGPYPLPSSLLLFIHVISLHTPAFFMGATRPIHSFDGLPLAKSVFVQSQFMVQMLLCLGAEPSRKGKLALYVAIRSGWLDGLITMIERDEAKIREWNVAMKGIRDWCTSTDEQRKGRKVSDNVKEGQVYEKEQIRQSEEDSTLLSSSSSKKRRRLLDRAQVDSKMLKEAVKHNRWPVVNWIRSKGVAPDLRTIKLIEVKLGGAPA